MTGPVLQWLDGRPSQAVSMLDRGLHYGDGLFETLIVHAGRIRLVDWHLERCMQGVQRLGLLAPDPGQLRAEWQRAATILGTGVLKALLTRGDAVQRGYAPPSQAVARRILLGYAEPIDPPVAPLVLWACTEPAAESRRLAGLKTLNRLEQVLASREWQTAAAEHGLPLSEGLMCDQAGLVVGGCSSNVFGRNGASWWTPRIERSGIAGVMRRVVCREAAAVGWSLQETSARLEDLLEADEIFMTNVRWHCRPVARLWYRNGTAHRDWPTDTPAQRQMRALIEECVG